MDWLLIPQKQLSLLGKRTLQNERQLEATTEKQLAGGRGGLLFRLQSTAIEHRKGLTFHLLQKCAVLMRYTDKDNCNSQFMAMSPAPHVGLVKYIE